MKVAMIHSPILGRGGGERQILRLAIELQEMGHTVEIFTSAVNQENSYPEMLKRLNVTVIPHPLGNKIPRWMTPLETAQRNGKETQTKTPPLKEWMRKNLGRQFYTIPYEVPSMINIGRKIPAGFDVINNHNYPSEWAAFVAKKKLDAPIVWMCNEPPFWFFVPELRRGLRKINWPVYNILDKTAADYVDEFLVLSKIAQGCVQKAYNRNSKVVRSGIDVQQFSGISGTILRRKYGLTDDFVLLQTGNIELNKRQTDSLRVLQILARRHDRIKLVFDGGGRREDLIKMSEKLGVRDKVLFLRSSTDEELREVYAASDVFLFPAQITWGLAVVEAMASAKPVIVSNRCGASEIIENNVNGIVVEHGNYEEMAKQVQKLLSDPDFCKRVGENASEYVEQNLSWRKFASKIEEIFEKTRSKYQK
jgi:glycosyltransferase involved in cell wall biosynthesis